MCKTNDSQWVVTDEIDVRDIFQSMDSFASLFASGANATNVWLNEGIGGISTWGKTNGTQVTLTPARWKAKGYARQ